MPECAECGNAIEDAARFCPHCGAASAHSPEVADPWIGRVVNGKFRVESLIGQGGMGKVYRARHLTLDRAVVLKILHPNYSSDPQVVQRFQREARAASRLNHPNSIAVLDFGAAEDGTLFMAMEFLSGRDLGRIIAEEFPLGEARIIRIGAQVLSALAEAHALGIIHRDLKPENVMVEPRRGEPDFVKVLDFGIAKLAAPGPNEPKLTQAGLVCGTPEYMSPEQARGADIDARSDLYAMGVVLYQMATGELPFQADTPIGFLTKHLSEEPARASERWADVSPALDMVIARAMSKDPSARFRTAEEMREALVAVDPAALATIARAPASAGVAAPRPPISKGAPPAPKGSERTAPAPEPPRRSRRVFWAFAGAMIVAAAGGGTVTYLARQSAVARRGAPDLVAPAERTANGGGGEASAPSNAAPARSELAAANGAQSPVAPPPSPEPKAPAAEPQASTPPPASPPEAPAPEKGPAHTKRDAALARSLYAKGEAKRSKQDIDGAIKLYLAAEARDPDLAEVQKKLGLCYQMKGDTRRAADRYRKYLATKPADADRVKAILSTLE